MLSIDQEITTILSYLVEISPETQQLTHMFQCVRTFSGLTNYGGCMVYLDTTIAAANPALNCPSVYLSLDCDAVHHTQAQANAMWSSALVAFSLQKNVNLYVDDSVKFNSFCMARRLDVAR